MRVRWTDIPKSCNATFEWFLNHSVSTFSPLFFCHSISVSCCTVHENGLKPFLFSNCFRVRTKRKKIRSIFQPTIDDTGCSLSYGREDSSEMVNFLFSTFAGRINFFSFSKLTRPVSNRFPDWNYKSWGWEVAGKKANSSLNLTPTCKWQGAHCMRDVHLLVCYRHLAAPTCTGGGEVCVKLFRGSPPLMQGN